ncbi:hypothetical protein EUA93_12735 [Nocardioides oleivorans]|uniref:Uncharacterized protein n=1 Tax=Nocardioides oleivorans TaxID=273676 RepID=A0A4Q2S4K0_9ACTN|nr:hypothetical protein [Nocardioides oleivorans]RYB95133.1 hypothetical protein EUA93_12735 [Nocardioides oleivorans]
MPDLDQIDPALDRAFDALARDLAHSPSPGASAAMATVRKRRRARVGVVALAALVVVGGGLTLPRVLSPEDGVAANGGSARLDAAAMDEATDGWIHGWTSEPRMNGSFSMPECHPLDAMAGATTEGYTVAFTQQSSADVKIIDFESAAALDASWQPQVDAISACDDLGAPRTVVVDGTSVLHWRLALPDDGNARMTDLWYARLGTRVGQLELATTEGAAPESAVRGVAEALVAGVRDGWTETEPRAVSPAAAKGPLPEWTGIDLEGALAGWRSPTKRAPTTSPNLTCLHDKLDGVTTASSGGGGSPWGLSYRVATYDDPDGGPADVDLVLDMLRACTTAEVRLETLPNGVHLATYDTGGPEPFNAIWLAANGDRAGMVAVERADRPMPQSARQDVADALHEILHLPWGP